MGHFCHILTLIFSHFNPVFRPDLRSGILFKYTRGQIYRNTKTILFRPIADFGKNRYQGAGFVNFRGIFGVFGENTEKPSFLDIFRQNLPIFLD